MTKIQGKLALITGGSHGIGLRIVERLAVLGAHVVLWARRREPLEEAARKISAAGGKVDWATVDVADRAQVAAAAVELKARLGCPDILINNAGVVAGKPLLELEDAEIEQTFAVNTLAHFWTLRAFLPDMIARDSGHVVTVSSGAGICAIPRLSDYCASKFAAFGLDEALRLELRARRSRVRTTVVCPYYIDTGMFRGATTRFAWLLPILETDDVASRVVRAIQKDRRRVIVPWVMGITWVARLLPVSWYDVIARFLGLDRGMDAFIGHRAARAQREPAAPSKLPATARASWIPWPRVPGAPTPGPRDAS